MSQILKDVADHASSVFEMRKKCQCKESVQELDELIKQMRYHHGMAIKIGYGQPLTNRDPIEVSTISTLIETMGKCIVKIEKKIHKLGKTGPVALQKTLPIKEGNYALRQQGAKLELSLLSDAFATTNDKKGLSDTSSAEVTRRDSETSTEGDFTEKLGRINTVDANKILDNKPMTLDQLLSTIDFSEQLAQIGTEEANALIGGTIDDTLSIDFSEQIGQIGTDQANRIIGGFNEGDTSELSFMQFTGIHGGADDILTDGITSLVDDLNTEIVNMKLDNLIGGTSGLYKQSSVLQGGSTTAIIRYWGGGWCGPSIRTTPAWDEFKEKIKTLHPELRVLHLNFHDKSDTRKQEILSKANVKFFPTIRLYHNGKVEEFKGDKMKAEEIVKFVNDNYKLST